MNKHIALSSGLIGLVLSACAMSNSLHEQALSYVSANAGDCTLQDGYECAPIKETDFLFEQDRMLAGNYLQVWPIVLADFSARDDLSAAQKELKHYKIGFTENETHYVVVFRALLLPEIKDGQVVGVLRSGLGKSMRYEVDKARMQVDKALFYR